MNIPFHKATMTGRENEYLARAFKDGGFVGDGPQTKAAKNWLKSYSGAANAVLTPSCTAGLEMASILCGLKPGDEVILPSFTFVSTANAIVLQGATPVFVDVRPDTLNIDEKKIERAITSKTKAIMVVHYAGVSCEMDSILELAKSKILWVIEDAAQGLQAFYKKRPLGVLGDFGALSFHGTKNVHCGEGGALLVRDATHNLRSEIVHEKGTNRSQFFRGEVDKYTWVEKGSSFLMSDLTAAFLHCQLEESKKITDERVAVWNRYRDGLKDLAQKGIFRIPTIPEGCEHNGHLFYLVFNHVEKRNSFFNFMRERGIGVTSHYVSLHSSPGGQRYGRTPDSMSVTEHASDCLLRLPLWRGIEPHVDLVLENISAWAKANS